MTGLPQGDSPFLLNSSYTITADIEVPEGGAEGMILTSGGRFAGYGFYLLKGKPVFLWNLIDMKRIKWEGPEALAPGKHTVEFDFKYDGLGVGTLAFNNMSGLGRGGTGTLKVDGKEVATQKMEQDAAHDPAMGRELRHRLRHAHRRERRRLQAAVPLHRQAQQADDQGGPAEALARGHQKTRGGHEESRGRQRIIRSGITNSGSAVYATDFSPRNGAGMDRLTARNQTLIPRSWKPFTK